jgi:homopolymeric O-antigen transport system permease protein
LTTEAVGQSSSPRTVHIVPSGGLLDLGLAELWSYRQLLFFFTWRDVKVRYKQTLIGSAWAVLQPFAAMVLFTVFFGNLLDLSTEGLPGPIFYYSSLLPWTYFSLAVVTASNSVVGNQNLIHKIYFPRLLLPMSAVLPGVIDFAIAFVVLVALMLGYGVGFTLPFVLFPLFVVMGVLLALALGVWLSILNARFRDIRFIVPFLVQMLFFASPIVYSANEIPERWRALYSLNPLVGVIEGFRWSITGVGEAPGLSVLMSLGLLLVVLISGLVYFRREEATIADIV